MYEVKQKEVSFENQRARLIVIRNISDLVKGEYQRSVEKLSDMMIASTSHDMKTPLNSIIGMLMLLKNRIYDEPLKTYIRIARNSSLLLLSQVNDTLDYFQLKSGKFSIK